MKHKFVQVLLMLLLLPILPIIGALKVKSIDASTEKWGDNAGRAADRYATEAEAAASDWATHTAKAAGTYGAAISAPGIKDRFAKGVARAGAEKYARKVRDVAKDRFAPGVAAATTDFKTGAEPYFNTLAGLTLSGRKPRGDPANYKRTEEVGKALNAKRLALLGGGSSASA